MSAMLQQIQASAGSGKTYTLTRQFLTLLKNAAEDSRSPACAIARAPGDPHCWPEILAVTFTNKAATEMRERIVRSLKERALDTERHNAASDWSSEAAQRWVNILLRRLSSLNVRTIDSLLNMLVRLSALELGLPPDFEPVFDRRDLYDPLYDQLLEAASAGGPEHALIAEACRTLLLHTEKEGFVPGESIRDRLYELTETRLADTARHQDDAPPFMDAETLRGWLVNLHSDYTAAAADVTRLMRDEGLEPQANFTKFLSACGESGPFRKPKSSAYAAKNHVDECLLKASRGKASPDLQKAYADLVQSHADLEGPGQLLRKALEITPFAQLAESLALLVEEAQRAQGRVPASLWPRYAERILTGGAGASEAFCRMGTRLTHLLIDEFQDTSVPQWNAIRPLAQECLSKAGSLIYVGDVKQAIYGWRGGDSALFESVLQDPEIRAVAPEPKRVNLPNNWRSSKEIVQFNNTVFSRLAEPDIALAFAEQVLSGASDRVVQLTADTIRHSFDRCAQSVPEHKAQSGGLVRLYDVSGEKTENLHEHMQEHMIRLFSEDLLLRRRPGDIAVLVRKNSEAALVTEWLVSRNIPVITENSLALAAHPVIRQIVALLHFLDYPLNDLAFWECLSGGPLLSAVPPQQSSGQFSGQRSDQPSGPVPPPYLAGAPCLPPHRLDDWLAAPRKGSLFAAFREAHPAQWRAWFAPFYSQAGLMSAYDTVREAFGRFRVLERFPQDAIFLRRFLEVVFAADERGLRSLSDFLEYWTESGGEEKVPMPENVNAVRVMTMHKSKGLEFPVVVVPFHHHILTRSTAPETVTVQGRTLLVPRCKELGDAYYLAVAAEAREQLNLLYVAWTRPVEELHAFITSTPFHEPRSPMLCALRLLLDTFGMGNTRDEREEEVTLGTPPQATFAPALSGLPQEPHPSDAASHVPTDHIPDGHIPAGHIPDGQVALPEEYEEGSPDWKPMQWLPRLKIFRNPLEEIIFDERRRGTLAHACLERLRLTGTAEGENLALDVARAIRYGMRAHPLPIPDRAAVEQDLDTMLRWVASLPDYPAWQRHGTPECAIMDARGGLHRTDLLVDDGHTLTVVEYKTGQPSPAHRQQATRYVNLLAAVPAYADRQLQSVIVYLDLRETVAARHPHATAAIA